MYVCVGPYWIRLFILFQFSNRIPELKEVNSDHSTRGLRNKGCKQNICIHTYISNIVSICIYTILYV